jgi:di/tricarboxylate transporter
VILTFLILAVTILLFIWGKLRPDLVAILSVLVLFLTGIINLDQALSGFADSTVIMVAALFVVAEALSRTGITAWLGQQLLNQSGASEVRLLVVLMVGTALLSAFLSNTGTVAMLLPAVVAAAWRIRSVPPRFLIPLAFAANTGGLLTLIGTPPNIIVADVLVGASLRPFGFFEFALIGLPLLAIVVLFTTFVGRPLLPTQEVGARPVDLDATVDELAEAYSLEGNLFRLRVRRGSSLVGKSLSQAGLGRDYGVSVLRIDRAGAEDRLSRRRPSLLDTLDRLRRDEEIAIPRADTVIQPDDVLLAKGPQDSIQGVMLHFNLGVQPIDETGDKLTHIVLSQEVGLAEVLITPRSDYIGLTLSEAQLAQKYDVQVLSISRQDKVADQRTARLEFGDSLLVRGTWRAIGFLKEESRSFVVVGAPEAMAREVVGLGSHTIVAVVALLGMVVLMLAGLVSAVIAALIAACMVVLGGCLSMEEAYRSVSWETLVLVAAMLPMSTALRVTGGAEFIAGGLVNTLGAFDPLLLMAGVFLLTAAFSQVISNTATTVLVAPIALGAALAMGISPHAMLMMVAVGASAAFLTPIASPPNTLVMTPGGYRFNDYVKVGLPLLFIFLVASLILVPLIWPL